MATIRLNNVYVEDSFVIAGKKEKEGPLSKYFDETFDDNYLGENSFEKAEIAMFERAIDGVLKKTGLLPCDIDVAVGGDLSNQIVSSNYVMRKYNVPFIGAYGACSTSALNVILGSMLLESGMKKRVLLFTGSHYNSAERQFRNPCEYGGQKKDCATTTVTGAGALILTSNKKRIKVTSVTIGKVVDYNQNNINDMGTAMAPSAFDTFKKHLTQLNRDPSYYDLILTGDLSSVGKELFIEMCKDENIILNNNYQDTGLMIYDVKMQDVFSGGSGCGCATLTVGGYIMKKLKSGELKRVLVIATGALLSPLIVYQHESIPSISHAYSLEVVE